MERMERVSDKYRNSDHGESSSKNMPKRKREEKDSGVSFIFIIQDLFRKKMWE